MRFLCLHGKGTNNKIFELQTAALRSQLGDDHVYDFIEGSVACERAPGISSISSTEEECFAYFDETCPASRREILESLDAHLNLEGPFDAVMAFSLGASLAATLIARHAQQDIDPPFRYAIFFCGGGPADPSALMKDQYVPLDHANVGEIIRIPTAHIWGRNDPRNPAWGPVLSQLCNGSLKSVFVHEGGHEIPGPRDKVALAEAVKCIQRAIDVASTANLTLHA